jgi:hypothetical protein
MCVSDKAFPASAALWLESEQNFDSRLGRILAHDLEMLIDFQINTHSFGTFMRSLSRALISASMKSVNHQVIN